MLYQSYLTKGAFAEEFDWLISIDARVEEALAFKDLSMTVLNSLRAVEVNESLLSCVGGHYCEAEVTVNSSCGVLWSGCLKSWSSRTVSLIFSLFLLFLVSFLSDETLELIELVANLWLLWAARSAEDQWVVFEVHRVPLVPSAACLKEAILVAFCVIIFTLYLSLSLRNWKLTHWSEWLLIWCDLIQWVVIAGWVL